MPDGSRVVAREWTKQLRADGRWVVFDPWGNEAGSAGILAAEEFCRLANERGWLGPAELPARPEEGRVAAS